MTLIQKTDQYGRPDYTEKWDWNVPEIPTFLETDSGRRRKGELEVLVDYVIKEWMVEVDYGDKSAGWCTAEYIAKRCTELDGRPTSSGAVWKILTHFKSIGYAELDTSPNRFFTLTELGLSTGLRQLLEVEKREKKKAKRNSEIEKFNKAQFRSKVRRSR